MRLLDLTLATPETNLALDEALLERAEASVSPCEVLRLWEPADPLVVVGASSRVSEEVLETECQQRGIPILRRPSGGASIVTGPGCLMYSVVLCHERRPALKAIDAAHGFVLGTLLAGLRPLVPAATCAGTSDLSLDGRKFSGNSLRCKRTHLLYHGTLLYDFCLDLLDSCLSRPPREPAYRAGRGHGQFVMNLPLTGPDLRRALTAAWQAHQPDPDWPADLTRRLAEEKYSSPEWNRRH